MYIYQAQDKTKQNKTKQSKQHIAMHYSDPPITIIRVYISIYVSVINLIFCNLFNVYTVPYISENVNESYIRTIRGFKGQQASYTIYI